MKITETTPPPSPPPPRTFTMELSQVEAGILGGMVENYVPASHEWTKFRRDLLQALSIAETP